MLPVLPYASSVAARLIHTQTHQSLQLPPSHELMNFKSDAHSDALHAGSRHVAGPAQQHSLDCAHTGHARALCVATASTALHQPSHNMLVTRQKPNPVPYHVSPPQGGTHLRPARNPQVSPCIPLNAVNLARRLQVNLERPSVHLARRLPGPVLNTGPPLGLMLKCLSIAYFITCH